MTTKITFIGDMPIEQQELDALGDAARSRLNELVLEEYAQTGKLSSVRLCEAVEAFETYAAAHILPPEEAHGGEVPPRSED